MEQFFQEVEQAISRSLGEAVRIAKRTNVGGGCINHASKLESTAGNFFLKWNDRCPPDMFAREAEGMQALAKAAEDKLVVPRVICHKDMDNSPGFLVLEYLEPGRSGQGSEEELGRGLAHIHQFKSEKFGFHHNNYCGATPQRNPWTERWPGFFRDHRLSFLLKLIDERRGLSSVERNTYERLLDRIHKLLPSDSVPALIHGDLWSGNYMLSEKGPALIDPAACFAEREMEFSIITLFGGFSSRFFEAYNEVFPLDSDWRSRNRLYQLYHILNHYFLFGGGYGSQALSVAKSYV